MVRIIYFFTVQKLICEQPLEIALKLGINYQHK